MTMVAAAAEAFAEKVLVDEYVPINLRMGRSKQGFYMYITSAGQELIFWLYAPELKKLGWMQRKTLRHEVGHVISIHMYFNDKERLLRILKHIKARKLFTWGQKIWYWNRVLRWIRIKMGFSIPLTYTFNEQVYPDFTHGDSELFSDWFAMKGLPDEED